MSSDNIGWIISLFLIIPFAFLLHRLINSHDRMVKIAEKNRDCKGYLARMIMVKFTNHFKDNKNMTQDDFWRLQKEMIDEEKLFQRENTFFYSDSNAKVNQSKKNEGKQGGTQ